MQRWERGRSREVRLEATARRASRITQLWKTVQVFEPVRGAAAAFVLGAVSLALAACAGAAPSPCSAHADAAIHAAEEVRAGGDRVAAVYLAAAQQDLAEGARLCSRGDLEGALGFQKRAEMDADLAALVARDAVVRRAMEKTEGEANLLEDELQALTGGRK